MTEDEKIDHAEATRYRCQQDAFKAVKSHSGSEDTMRRKLWCDVYMENKSHSNPCCIADMAVNRYDERFLP